MEYAKELTKNYLKKLGVTKVTRTGKVYKNNKPAKQNLGSDGYLRVTLYDKDIYNLLYPITKQRNSGEISIAVHRIVYTWFNDVAPNGLVIDHIDNNKQNNNINNLQALTPGENIWKDREHGTWLLKCKKRTKEYYIDKLNYYLEEYEKQKLLKNAEKVHKLRSYISQYRARIRFWEKTYETFDNRLENRGHTQESR